MNFIQHNLDTIYGFLKKCYKIMLAFFIIDEIVDKGLPAKIVVAQLIFWKEGLINTYIFM